MNEPSDDPTIYEVISEEHEEVAELLAELAGETDVARAEELFITIHEQLDRHARAEETVFYDVLLRGDEEARALARAAVADHQEIRRLLAELARMDAGDRDWGDGVTALTQAVERHVETEESSIFAATRAALDDDQARTLAETFEAMEARVEPEDEAEEPEAAA